MVMSIDVQFIVSGCPYPFGRYADALGYAALLAKNLKTNALILLHFPTQNLLSEMNMPPEVVCLTPGGMFISAYPLLTPNS